MAETTSASPDTEATDGEEVASPHEPFWLWIAAIVLLAASFENTATSCARVLLLWSVGLWIRGRWGRSHLSAKQRAFLTAVLGLGMVHLVLFPARDKAPLTEFAKHMIIWLPLLALIGQAIRWVRWPAPFPHWNLCVVGFLFVSAGIAACQIAFPSPDKPLPMTSHPAFLVPLAYLAIFGWIYGGYVEDSPRWRLLVWLEAVPLGVAAVAILQILLMGLGARRAESLYAQGDLEPALGWNQSALRVNERLRIRAADKRLLLQRARILDELDRPAEALQVMFRRTRETFWPPEDPAVRSFCNDYLTTAPLESHIAALSSITYLDRLEQTPLPESPSERTFLLGLFVRQGLLDRLLLEYTYCGLNGKLSFASLRQSLEQVPAAAVKTTGAWGDYFLGICDARLGRKDMARDDFRRVLNRWPNYHNACVWLERLSTSDTVPVLFPKSIITNAQMIGNHRWGLNVDDALWTALEVRPGRCSMEFEVSGLGVEGGWPILQVYLDGKIILDQPVRGKDWTRVRCEAKFDQDGRHLLVVAFPNDINRSVDGRNINRNLYFRQVMIERLGKN